MVPSVDIVHYRSKIELTFGRVRGRDRRGHGREAHPPPPLHRPGNPCRRLPSFQPCCGKDSPGDPRFRGKIGTQGARPEHRKRNSEKARHPGRQGDGGGNGQRHRRQRHIGPCGAPVEGAARGSGRAPKPLCEKQPTPEAALGKALHRGDPWRFIVEGLPVFIFSAEPEDCRSPLQPHEGRITDTREMSVFSASIAARERSSFSWRVT